MLLVGEIYQRVDEFCCQGLGERLADEGFLMRTAPIFEWLRYVEWLVGKGYIGSRRPRSLKERLEDLIVGHWEGKREQRLKHALAASGLYEPAAQVLVHTNPSSSQRGYVSSLALA